MSPPGGRDRRILALLGAELRTLLRDYGTLVSLLALTVLVGVLAHGEALLPDTGSDEDDDDDGRALVTWPCRPAELPPVAIRTTGDGPPPWLDWPGPQVPPLEAEVLIEVGPAARPGAPWEIEAVAVEEDARLQPVMACLRERRTQARQDRLEGLGITALPDEAVTVAPVLAAPGGAGERLDPPTTRGLSMAGGLALLLLSVFLDAAPRARASGWLESWLVTPGRRSDLVLAWWILGLLVGSVGAAFVALGHAIGAESLGADIGTLQPGAVPPLIALLSALGVRAFLDVEDVRTALVRSIPVLLATVAAFGLAAFVEARAPGWGAAVPLGGLALVLSGWSDGVMLAAVSGLLATGLLLWDSTRVLDRLAVSLGALGATAARRARGDYLPEAFLLFVIAAAGAGAWAPPELILPDVVLRTLLTMGAFFLLPALLVHLPLGLDRGPLLSWRPPPLRAWLLLPLLLPATLTLAGKLWALAVALGPSNDLLQRYAQLVGEFSTPLGLVAVSVVPGICEEVLFRGAMLGLLRHRLPTWAAVLLQAVAFALLHGLAVRLPYTFGLGLVFGLLVVRSGSLWPAIVAHLLHNLVSTQLPPEAFEAWIAHPATWIVGLAAFPLAWASGPGRR